MVATRPRLIVVVWVCLVGCLPIVYWRMERDSEPWTADRLVSEDSVWKTSPDQQPLVEDPHLPLEFRDGFKRNRTKHEEGPRVIYAIMQYPYLLDKLDQGKVPFGGEGKYRAADPKEVRRRQEEYHQAMMYTLAHPAITQLNVLLNSTKDLGGLYYGIKHSCLELLPNQTQASCIRLLVRKLVTYELGHVMTYGDAFAYANQELSGFYVLLLNSDTYPIHSTTEQDGWMRVRPHHFGRNDQGVFMLSRESPACPGRPEFNLPPRPAAPCKKMAQWGSADAFVFRAPVPESVVREMKSFPTNYWGAENRAAAALKRAGYGPFLNPCTVLRLGHVHCSRVRVTGWNAPRINQGRGRSVVGRFLTQLPGD